MLLHYTLLSSLSLSVYIYIYTYMCIYIQIRIYDVYIRMLIGEGGDSWLNFSVLTETEFEKYVRDWELRVNDNNTWI